MALTDAEQRKILLAALVSASLSAAGSLCIVGMYWSKEGEKRRELFPVRIILYLSLFDLPTSLVTIFGALRILGAHAWEGTVWCDLQGSIVQGGFMGANLWTAVLAVVLHRQLVTGTCTRESWRFHVAIASACVVTAALPLLGTSFARYGQSGPWCWISNDHGLGRQLLFYCPLYVMQAVVIACYVRIFRTVRGTIRKLENALSVEAIRKREQIARQFLLYPVAFMTLWLGSAINRGHHFATGEQSFELTLVQACTTPAQGFINFIIYVLTTNWGRHQVYRTVVHARRSVSVWVSKRGSGSSKRAGAVITSPDSVAADRHELAADGHNHEPGTDAAVAAVADIDSGPARLSTHVDAEAVQVDPASPPTLSVHGRLMC